MSTLFEFLAKERIVPLSRLQKNPNKALSEGIIRITKNGEEFGIFFAKEEWEDFIELMESMTKSFQGDMKKVSKEKTLSASKVFKDNKLS